MNKFEAVLIFSPDLSNPIMSKEEAKFSSSIESEKGKIIGETIVPVKIYNGLPFQGLFSHSNKIPYRYQYGLA